MKRSITLITNYYPPETGAAANRIALMASQFVKAGFETEVICPLPNYPTGSIFSEYKGKGTITEHIHGVRVTRLWIYATKSTNRWKRLLAMLSFSYSLMLYKFKNKLPHFVFIQCSPLLVGFFGTFLFRSSKRKLLLNVSDLWPLAGKELGKLKEGWGYTLLERIERFAYRNAHIILGQSQEILTHVTTLFPDKNTFLYRNYPNFDAPKVIENPGTSKRLVYAGLLGVAQGIYTLCKEIELPNDWELHIYGDGTEREQIQQYLATSNKSILYRGSLSRKRLHKELPTYDLTIIPLIKRIYGSVPLKIFEYSRLGLPLVYFGGGEGEQLVKKNNLGWVVPSGDYNALNKTLNTIASEKEWPAKEDVQRTSIQHFSAQKQFEELLDQLV